MLALPTTKSLSKLLVASAALRALELLSAPAAGIRFESKAAKKSSPETNMSFMTKSGTNSAEYTS